MSEQKTDGGGVVLDLSDMRSSSDTPKDEAPSETPEQKMQRLLEEIGLKLGRLIDEVLGDTPDDMTANAMGLQLLGTAARFAALNPQVDPQRFAMTAGALFAQACKDPQIARSRAAVIQACQNRIILP